MAVEVADVIRVVARLNLLGVSDVVNVFHFIVAVQDLLDDDAVMEAVAEIMDDAYTLINTQVSDRVGYISVDGQNLSKNELLPSKDWPVLTVGGNTANQIPEMTAACVFFRTITPRVRTSKFLPPFGDNANVDGALGTAAVTACEAFGDFMIAPLVATDFQMGYVSRNRVTEVITAVSSRVVPARFRTQRRRRIGVGS